MCSFILYVFNNCISGHVNTVMLFEVWVSDARKAFHPWYDLMTYDYNKLTRVILKVLMFALMNKVFIPMLWKHRQHTCQGYA